MTDGVGVECRPDQVQAALRRAAVSVLETMFFVSLAGETEEPSEAAPEFGQPVRVEFQGGCQGAFTIRVSGSMSCSMAANFLAKDEQEVDEPEASQVVSEFANMVCGATLSVVAPHATLNLSYPCAGTGVVARGEVYRDALVCDCGRVQMQLEFWHNE
ncbi:MAG: chemotaxis protein CheX [Bryobacterales bacterium]|nr:chemotaxis protein CheX [Bryobacterales bacterium]